MPFLIVKDNIVSMNVDAVVNAANTDLLMGGGVCGAIFNAAGARRLQAACDKLAPINTGEAVITPGFDLSAKFIIHTAGPVYSKENAEECERLLRSSYTSSLELALENGCESIAFPLISSGIYGYPKDEALQVASAAIKDFLFDNDMLVYLVILDRSAFAISKSLQSAIDRYISIDLPGERQISACYSMSAIRIPKELGNILENLDEPFNVVLMHLIAAKGKTETEVYRKANIDRRLFSKIRTGDGYMPGKRTIIALAIALELSEDETENLLEIAGYALSHSQKFDAIIRFFIKNKRYDIFEINEVLFKYDQPLLGGS